MASIWPHRAHLKNLLSSLSYSYILEVWKMNCRKRFFAFLRTKVGFLSFLSQLLLVFGPVQGQNWSFCPFLPSRTAILVAFEDKSAHFVLFWSTFSRFLGFSRTKTSFLSSGGLPNSIFGTSRAQNWYFCALGDSRTSTFPTSRAQKLGFCALLPSRTALFRPPERKIGIFARFWPSRWHFFGLSSAKVRFLRAFVADNK